MDKSTKKRRQSKTAAKSYKQLTETGRDSQIQKMILELLKESKPLTRRQISQALCVEISSLCNALRVLQDIGKLKISHVMPCETTGRLVSFFTIHTFQFTLF